MSDMTSAAEKAALHVVNRIKRDPQLAFFFDPLTESFELLTAAYAELRKLDVEDFRKSFAASLKFERPRAVEPATADLWSCGHTALGTCGECRRELAVKATELQQEVDRLTNLFNTPETRSFIEGAVREAGHQIARWGEAHDRNKTPDNWFWLVGYLAGKALQAHIAGDLKKAEHHTISSAAVLAHWHRVIKGTPHNPARASDLEHDLTVDGLLVPTTPGPSVLPRAEE